MTDNVNFVIVIIQMRLYCKSNLNYPDFLNIYTILDQSYQSAYMLLFLLTKIYLLVLVSRDKTDHVETFQQEVKERFNDSILIVDSI
jgi:hypothetical protein